MIHVYPKGSEWRKWDLHIHTPASFFWKGEKKLYEMDDTEKIVAIKSFIDIVNNSDIAVYGVQDYWTFDWILELRKYLRTYPGALNKTVLPGMELRVECPVNYRLNIHVLLSDKVTDQQLEDFRSELKIRIGAISKNVSDEALITFAKSLDASKAKIHGYADPDTLTNDKLLELGSMTAEITRDSLTAAFKHLAKDSGFVVLPYDTSDGLLALDWSSQPQADNYFMQTADIFESRDQKNIDLLNGKKTVDNEKFFANFFKTLGNKTKPCIAGSDAHKFTDYGKYPSDKATWIKADPTFEGLKQIIFEPGERAKIQIESPYQDVNKIFFSGLDLSGSTNFILPDFKLPLNRELVALIGGRGSGKSALLETIALLNEEHLKKDQNNKKKIIEYYRDNEDRVDPPPRFSFGATLVDKDGEEADLKKDLNDRTNLELPFLYLGQEQLSGTATNDFELTRTVCELIGINVHEIGQEALISKARSVLSDIDNTEKQAENIEERYADLGYTHGTNIVDWIKKHLEKLLEQQKRLSSKETRHTLEDINKKTKQGLNLKELNEKTDALLLTLRDTDLNQEINHFNLDLVKLYPDSLVVPVLHTEEQRKVLSNLRTRIKLDMDVLRKEIIDQKNLLIKQGIKEDVNSLLQASENLQRQITGIEKDLVSYTESRDKIKSLLLERNRILVEMKESVDQLTRAITEAYKDFQISRSDSTPQEKELFENIIKDISVEGNVEFNFKRFSKYVLENCLDNRKVSSESELKKTIAGENTDGTPREVTFENLTSWIQGDLSLQKLFNRGGLDGITKYIFTKWPEFLQVKAIAKLNGKPTEVLSIGQRGTLLLKVYLATSTAKQVFIIDQPEDNLDNHFIMHELVPLIRRAKKSRQIIMSTHNANLVVNADAEQIVVARLDQEDNGHLREYVSGSIENPEINQHIRDILEGGEQAFLQRERKYLLTQ